MSNRLDIVGGNIADTEANEGIRIGDAGRVLIAQKLTYKKDGSPKVVEGIELRDEEGEVMLGEDGKPLMTPLKNIDLVFEKFKPEIDMEYKKPDGSSEKETLEFKKLDDFGKEGILRNSSFLNNLQIEQKEFLNIKKQLMSNTNLKEALNNPEMKNAIVQLLDAKLDELKQAEQKNKN